MLKEIKYFIFFLVIILFILFSIKYYISNENIKKTYRNLGSIDKNINMYDSKLPVIVNDTDNIVKYLNNEGSNDKKKYSFLGFIKK